MASATPSRETRNSWTTSLADSHVRATWPSCDGSASEAANAVGARTGAVNPMSQLESPSSDSVVTVAPSTRPSAIATTQYLYDDRPSDRIWASVSSNRVWSGAVVARSTGPLVAG